MSTRALNTGKHRWKVTIRSMADMTDLSILVEGRFKTREDARIYVKGIRSMGLVIGHERFYECRCTTKKVR